MSIVNQPTVPTGKGEEKMTLVHYSKDRGFKPKAIETVGGFGKGCFFYVEGEEHEWSGRYRTTWEAPAKIVEFVQEFEPGEIPGQENKVTEVFVSAKNLRKLK